jgi:pilus assembly protein CpaE
MIMNDKIAVGLQIRNQKVRSDFEEILSHFRELSLREFALDKSYDLLILEIGENLEKDFEKVQSIQISGLVQDIFLTSSRLEPELLIRALRAGAREFIPQPVQKEEVREAIKRIIEKKEESERIYKKRDRQGKIINVIGSKGGVGTTTIAVNLATSLAKVPLHPASVVLIDMNSLFGEIPIFLDIQPDFNWAEVVRNISRLDSHYLMSILCRHKSGIHVLPSPTGLDGIGGSTPEFFEKILELMKQVFDFIVIDGGQSLDNVSLKILEMSDFLFLIGILSLPCLTNLKRFLGIFEKLGYPENEKIKIVMNRYHKKSLISLKDAEGVLNQKIFGLIDNDYPTTMSAINQGKTLESVAPAAEVTKNIERLASTFFALKK